MSDDRKKPIGGLVRNGIYLAVCFSCIFALTAAWFIFQKSGDADAVEFASIEAVGFEASLDGENFYDRLEISYPDNLCLAPVSGDGLKMYSPYLPAGSDDADEAIAWTPVEYDDAASVNTFYRLHVYFRADVAGYVALSDLNVDPKAPPENRQSKDYVNELGETVEVSGTVDRPFSGSLSAKLLQDAGIITRDYIAAATRVSITNTGTVDAGIAKHFIVIPNGGFALSTLETTDVNTGENCYEFGMTEGSQPDLNRKTYHYYVGPTGIGAKTEYGSRDFNYYYDNYLDSSAVYVLRLHEDPEDGIFKGEADICLWVEGYDEEAADALSGGNITMDLTFQYIEKAPEAKGGEQS